MLENFLGMLVLLGSFILGFWILTPNILNGKFRSKQDSLSGSVMTTVTGIALVWYSVYFWYDKLVTGCLWEVCADFLLGCFYVACAALAIYLVYKFFRHAATLHT